MVVVSSSRILRIALWAALCLGCPADDAKRESEPIRVWPRGDLVSVDLFDESRAVVLVATGEIYLTRDLGMSWQRAHVPAVAGLQSISMFDSDSGWAAGQGVILRTDDGGSSWRRQRLPMQADRIRLGSIIALDAEHGIALSSDGTRLATRDGGRLWRDVSQVAAARSDSLARSVGLACDAESKGRCWSVGSELLSTTDAGETWRSVEVEDFAQIEPIVFGVARVEVGSAERERFNKFIVENRHRSQLTWTLEPGISSIELERIGQRRDPEALFELIDARMQELRSMIEEAALRPDLVVDLSEPPWDYADFLDDDPEILDRYWSARAAPQPNVAVHVMTPLRLAALCVGDSRVGIAVGEGGALIRSMDRGARWVSMAPFSPHDLLDVEMIGPRVVVVGGQGGLWVSEDEGLSWGAPARSGGTPFFDALRSVSFSPTGQFGLVVGEKGRMLRTRNGGVDWENLGSDGPFRSASPAETAPGGVERVQLGDSADRRDPSTR